MNDDNQYELPNFHRPTETLLRQLVQAAAGRLSVPLRVIDFRPARQSGASATEGKVTLKVNGVTQSYAFAARGRIRSREEVTAIVAKGATADLPILLATTYLTPALADECIAQGLQFIDLAGWTSEQSWKCNATGGDAWPAVGQNWTPGDRTAAFSLSNGQCRCLERARDLHYSLTDIVRNTLNGGGYECESL